MALRWEELDMLHCAAIQNELKARAPPRRVAARRVAAVPAGPAPRSPARRRPNQQASGPAEPTQQPTSTL